MKKITIKCPGHPTDIPKREYANCAGCKGEGVITTYIKHFPSLRQFLLRI